MKNLIYSLTLLCAVMVISCKKDKETVPVPQPSEPNLVFKFKFDSTQVRLNNIGQPVGVPPGNAAQSPVFNAMSAHYIELARTEWDSLGKGEVLYLAPQTTSGGSDAIDFSKSVRVGDGEVFFKTPLKNVKPGSYKYLRVSLAYQNYDIKYKQGSISGIGTIASFIGFNTYISSYKINTQEVILNENKLQGYWGFETTVSTQTFVVDGQAPEGATTVPNPLFATSPIPQGSCVVTGPFERSGADLPLTISGNETSDVIITVSLSTNNSFEWEDVSPDGLFEPNSGDNVVDMGVRGMKPIW